MHLTKTGVVALITIILAVIVALWLWSKPAAAQDVIVTPLPSPGFTLPDRAAAIVGGCGAGLGAFAAAAGATFPISVPIVVVSVLICSIAADTALPE